MWRQKSRCPNCNAPLAEGVAFCDYCDLNSRGGTRSPSTHKTRGGWSVRSTLKLGLGAFSLMCCVPTGIFGTLHETVYAIHMDAPKYSARPLSIGQRPLEALTVTQVFMDMHDTEDHPLAQRKQEWREKYAGHWVSWEGVVEEVRPYDSLASELLLRPENGPKYRVEVNFDPIHNTQLNQLRQGQVVRVSGRVWGYYFMDDTLRLSEGALLPQDGTVHGL